VLATAAWLNARGVLLATLPITLSRPITGGRPEPTTPPAIIREIRRRTRVVVAFPDGHSALIFRAASLRHVVSTKWAALPIDGCTARPGKTGGSSVKVHTDVTDSE